MATVPQYQIGQVKDSAVSGGFQQVQTNSDAFGAGIAQANINQGQAISQLGEVAWDAAFKQRDKFDQAVLKDQDNQLQTYIREQMDDPGGYLSLNGRAALDQKAIIEKALEDRMKLLGKDVDQRILDQWKTVANQRIQTAMGRISKHSATQTTNYYNQVSDSRIAGALNDSITNWSSEAEREKYINFGLNEVNQKIERLFGITPNTTDEASKDILDSARMEFTSPTHTGIIEKYLAADDYDGANTYFTVHKSEIKADAQLALQKTIDANTRDGQVRTNALRIWGMDGLSDTEQLEQAEKISDAGLSALVVDDLKKKQSYRDKEVNDAQVVADDEAQKLVTDNNITSLDQIPKELYNEMSVAKKESLKQYFRQEEQIVRTENYRVAGTKVLNQYAVYMTDKTQPLPSVSDILKMKPSEAIAFMKTRDQDILDAATADELDAYKKIRNFIAEGGTKKDMDKGLWAILSGEQKDMINDRYKLKLERLETIAYDQGLQLIADGQEIPREIFVQMDGIQRLAIQKEQVGFDNRAESVAYDKLLDHLLIPGNNYDTAPDSLKEGVSPVNLYAIQSALNTSKAAQAVKDNKITQLLEYDRLLTMASENPDAFANEDMTTYVNKVSETNWKKLDDMQRNPSSVKSVMSRQNLVYQTLAGLDLVSNDFNKDNISSLVTESGDDGDNVRGFIADVDDRVQAWADSNPGKIMTDDDFRKVLSNAATDKVFYDDKGQDSVYPASFISADERDDAYILDDDNNKLKMGDIEQDMRDSIVADMRANGETVSEKAIRDRFEIIKASQINLKVDFNL